MPEKGWDFPTDLIEAAAGIIANAGGGDWGNETPEWREAARRWRDAYHLTLPAVECALCGDRVSSALVPEHMDGHGYVPADLREEIANAEVVDLTGEPS